MFRSNTFLFDKRFIHREALRHWSLCDFLQGWWPTVCRGLVPPNPDRSQIHILGLIWSPCIGWSESYSYFWCLLCCDRKNRCYWIWSYFDVVGNVESNDLCCMFDFHSILLQYAKTNIMLLCFAIWYCAN